LKSHNNWSRTWLHRAWILTLTALLAGGPGVVRAQGTDFDPASFAVGFELVVDGLTRPVQMLDPGDGSGRLFIVEQGGTVRILQDGELLPDPFLDISGQISFDNEQGLLSIAFHPDFASNGLFFIDYTDGDGDTQVERWTVSDDPNRADPESAETLLQVGQPYPNHNGGLLLFGPNDGYLYVGLGDGGSQGDPEGHGQDTSTWLGSILRIDVDSITGDLPYGIPEDNPFANGENGAPEIWLWGFRNPWRFSFDRANGDLYIGDVGQGSFEEIDRFPSDGEQRNFGWNVMEASSCYEVENCDASDYALPIFEYSHDFGCSVTGGFVYRGESLPALAGVYLAADYCSGLLWGIGSDGDGSWVASEPIETGLNVSSFGEDASGELYVVDLNGGIYRIVTA
jgi:glucose/arabinose dehydrogenase